MAFLLNPAALLNYAQNGRFFWIIILIGITSLFTVFVRYCIWRRKFSQQVPGLPPRFFNPFGNIRVTSFKRPPGCRNAFDIYYMQEATGFSKLFQNSRLFCYWMFYTPFVIVMDPEAVEKILKVTTFLNKAFFYKWVHPVIGTGLITSGGSKWKSRRKLLNPFFRHNFLKEFIPIMDQLSRVLVKRLRQETDKDSTEVATYLVLCSLDIICETILGVPMEVQADSSVSKLVQSLLRAFRLIARRVKNVHLWSDLIYGFTKDGKEMKEQVRIWKYFTQAMLQKKKSKYLSGDLSTGDEKRKSLMDFLLEHHLQTKDFSEDDIREELDTMTVAGSDTTSHSLSWTLYLLGLNPKIQTKVHEELDKIFGENVAGVASEDDLNDMRYLECVIKESLRIYPPLPAIAREITEDFDLCGYKLCKGTTCVVMPYLLHHNENLFPNPEIFDPDRFLPENSVNRHPYAFIPFSAGPRSCIGFRLAMMEMKIILSNLMRNYTIESLEHRDKLLPGYSLLVRPSKPIRLRIRYRSPLIA